MGQQKSADAVVAEPIGEGLNVKYRRKAGLSMVTTDAGDGAEMPHAHPKGSSRKLREQGKGASTTTARPQSSDPEGELRLMERMVSRENMMTAYHRVMANKGSAGIDKMTVEQLQPHLKECWPHIKEELLDDRYMPKSVRGVQIPKPGGGMRQLGIPTVMDRLIQQAMHQVLMPLFDPGFSTSSYGLRPGRSAHDAVLAARAHMADGRRFVVDIDLEKFFDRVNHDVLMARVARRVKDKRVLRLIRRYLQAGLMMDGLMMTRTEGTPQGGPLSPLLSNILLDDLDKELERRGHAFCRYADDCNIYVRTRRAGERVMASITGSLAERLRLKVNSAKSAVDRPWSRTFLGYTVTAHKQPRLRVAAKSVERLRLKLRTTLRQGRGRSLTKTIETLTPILRGWMQYFWLAEIKAVFEELDGWMRRKLRCLLWRQWKRPRTRAKELMRRGIDQARAWTSATNGRGPWWNAGASHMNDACRARLFLTLGLPSFQSLHQSLNRS
jgi:RNA-directed DNA polymerase